MQNGSLSIRPFAAMRIACFCLILLLVVSLLAGQTFKLKSGQSVYVVAVRNSRLFTMCAGTDAIVLPAPGPLDQSQLRVSYLSDGTQRIMIPESYSADPFRVQDIDDERQVQPPRIRYILQNVILPAPAFRSSNKESASPDQIELDRIALDPELKGKIEKEFLKQKRYKLVDSAAKADFVFLVEGYYVAMAGWGQSGALVIQEDTDATTNLLKAALAIALPAADFRSHFGDGAALVQAKLWEGSVISRELPPQSPPFDTPNRTNPYHLVPAVPESLVKQFHNKEKKPANYPPVCAATAGMLSLPSGAGVVEDARSKPILKGDSGSIPPVSSTQGQKAAANDKTIRIDVSLVTVPVFVGDKDGNYVPDLKPSDFHVFEDNVEQKIDRLIPGGDPHNVVLMLDTSNSMGPTFGEVRSDVQSVVFPFVDALRAEDRVMLVSFDNRVIVRSEFTSDHNKLRGAITRVPFSPPTRLYDAIDLVKTARLDGIPGRKAMILVTDGVDTRSRLADSASTLKGIEEGNVLIYIIQCDTKSEAATGALTNAVVYPKSKTGWIPFILPDDVHNQDERYAGADKYLYDLSKGSGGELYFAATIANVREILPHIAEELGHEYTICYYPSNTTSSVLYRRIHVTVNVPGVTIRARPGYRAGWAP